MARKSACKKNSPKKSKKRPSKKISIKLQLLKVFAGLGVLLLLVVAAGFSVHYMLVRKQNVKPSFVTEETKPSQPVLPQKKLQEKNITQKPEKSKTPSRAEVKTAKIPPSEKPTVYEIFPEKDLPPPKVKEVPPEVAAIPPTKAPLKERTKVTIKGRPKVAIIIDDLGYDPYIAKKFAELEPKLTFSVIPHTPFQKKVAEIVRLNGGELMLHVPMEPNEYPDIDPGPGALLTSMEPDQLIAQLKINLDTISDIRGINGHMGSKLTASSEQMYQIFTILKQRKLYFVDSFTTPDSVCKPSATLLKLPFAQRDVFIDHFLEPEFMRKQVHRLIKTAKKNGEAIGIAHPHKATLEIMKELMPEIKKQVDLVPASQLVK
jgi:polysaccharide deacetylase 2 family uncharacterized protein YibQ